MFKRILALLLITMLLLSGCAAKTTPPADPPAVSTPETPVAVELPAAQTVAGDYTFENSGINFNNLLEYIDSEDVLFIDLRNYEDYSKKHFRNFEVIPFFAFIYNEKAGEEGFPQLYKGTPEAPVAVYESSEVILNALFPKDKTIMLMCQSGGRVAMLMKILAANGYDMSKIYNIGGMAQYTDEMYRSYITDTEELNVAGAYTVAIH